MHNKYRGKGGGANKSRGVKYITGGREGVGKAKTDGVKRAEKCFLSNTVCVVESGREFCVYFIRGGRRGGKGKIY